MTVVKGTPSAPRWTSCVGLTRGARRLVEEAEKALKERIQKMFGDAGTFMDRAQRAMDAAGGGGGGGAGGAEGGEEGAELHKMWVRAEAGKEEEAPDYHALAVLSQAAGVVKDLQGAVDKEDEEFRGITERLEGLQGAVKEAEKRLLDEAGKALKDLEAVLKRDTKNMSPETAQDIARVRVACEGALGKLKAVGANKGRDLAALETRLRSTWDRGLATIKTALRTQLTRGDADLDAAMAALKKGALPAATAQLAKAKAAYENAKLAQAIAVGEDAK